MGQGKQRYSGFRFKKQDVTIWVDTDCTPWTFGYATANKPAPIMTACPTVKEAEKQARRSLKVYGTIF